MCQTCGLTCKHAWVFVQTNILKIADLDRGINYQVITSLKIKVITIKQNNSSCPELKTKIVGDMVCNFLLKKKLLGWNFTI